MSSYRSYAPWKSSLGSSYKTGSSSYGAGGDSTSRYSSLATPSAYRPSFSGGTYRLKRDPPTTIAPAPVTSYVSRYAKTEPKETAASERSSPIKRYTGAGASSSTLGKYGRSRDPSPVALEHTNRGKSRDPSPVIDSGRSKLGASYRSGNTSTSSSSSGARNGYGSRFGAAASRISNGSSNGSAISYLTTSDFHARTASRARASREKEQEVPVPTSPPEKPREEQQKGKQASPQKEQEQEKVQQDPPSEETFVSVAVVTRATSPTPPGSTTVQRTRRIDIAKTIEKSIQRSTKPRQMLEKETQSDRMDDSTRYLRYSGGGSSSLSSTYSPHRDRISSLRYSASPLSSKSASPSVEGKSSASAASSASPAEVPSPASKSNGALSNGSSAKSSASASKSKLSPPKAVRLNASRQSSVENLANKPPAAPTKSESPTKTCSSSSSGSSAVKWPNKDFRKSSLNVGPTDRPRKSRTPSGGESEDVGTNGAGSGSGQLERSPSAGSEGSLASAGSGKKSSKLSNGKTSSSSAGSRQGTSSSSAATSSTCTSASDSEQRGVKTVKKQSKKKTPKEGKVVAGHAGQLLANQNSRKSNTPAANAAPESPSPESHNADADADPDPNESPVAAAPPSNRSPQSRRLQKLSSVSNFFANRQQDANSEPIFLESSESSGEPDAAPPSISLATDLNTNEPRTKSTPKTTPTSEANTSTRSPLSPPSSSTRCPATTRISTAHTPTTISSSSTTTTQDTSLSTTSEQDPSQEEPSWWQDTSLQINTASALDQNNPNGEMPPYRLRHIDSGEEQAWWLRRSEADDEGDDDTLAEETLNTLDDDPSHWSSQDQELETHSKVKQMPRSRISPEQDAWWLEEEQEQEQEQPPSQTQNNNNNNNNETHVEVTLKLPSGSRSSNSKSHSDDGPKHWWMSGPTKKLFNVQRVESGERAWWQDNNEKEKEKEKEMEPPPVKPPTPPPRIIKHWESGERAWWLQDEPEAAQSAAAVAVAANASSDEEEEEEQQQQQHLGRDETDLRRRNPQQQQLETPHELSSSFHFAFTERPPPLGQCASPVPTEQRPRCPSPYDNIPMGRAPMPAAQSAPPTSLQPRFSPQMRRPGEKLFISRHQNIDELLGGACRPLSPLFYNNSSSDAGPESGTNMFLLEESSSLANKNMFLLEEITPDQVRIHDSTAQRPVIQRMQRDVEWLENGSSFYEPPKQHQQQQQQRRVSGSPPSLTPTPLLISKQTAGFLAACPASRLVAISIVTPTLVFIYTNTLTHFS
ncbi:formin-J-like [Drosophila obscura]|uniref:formin-J-like n=1 Tax=Drosophila obscura TaxID=7282 RepID=UPI001BB21C38|nr:formin-J-like [Drosophila obscura]